MANTDVNPHKSKTAIGRFKPNRIKRCERWSWPPWNGETPRKIREQTPTDVSWIGTARMLEEHSQIYQA
jgi:hypothetical protein